MNATLSSVFVGSTLLCIALCGDVHAQHCAPIVESYLSGAQLKRNGHDLDFEFEYSKTGGQRKNAYQAYVVAFRHSSLAKIAKMTPQQAIEGKRCKILHTQVAKKNKSGSYSIGWKLETQAFVKAMLDAGLADEKEVSDFGGWKQFDSTIRIAVFIPFLEDETYSTLKELPKDKHECNYRNDSALLFETLPQRITVHFGIVQAVRIEQGKYYVQINGNRPNPDSLNRPDDKVLDRSR